MPVIQWLTQNNGLNKLEGMLVRDGDRSLFLFAVQTLLLLLTNQVTSLDCGSEHTGLPRWLWATTRLPVRKTWLLSLGREELLHKAMAPRSGTLAWRIPWTEEAGGLQSVGSQRAGHD